MTDSKVALRGRPTLLIGLGGTGVSVAQHYKRRLLETAAGEDAPGFVRILAMDADQVPNRQPQLEPFEFVDLTGQISTLLHDIEHGGAMPECKRWLPRLSGYQHLGISGVGGVRPLGRLLFHRWKEQRVHPKFLEALKAVTDQAQGAYDTLRRGHETGRRAGVDIHMVFSLCGGVGAGTFLDAALWVRRWTEDFLSRETPIAVRAHAVLPDVFSGEPVREDLLQANTYAALSELDAFMEAQLPAGYVANEYPLRAERPVFDECNLLGAVTNVSTSRPDEIFRDLAECIRLRTVTEVRQQMEVGLTNRAEQTRGTADGADGRINAYSTYGVAALRLDDELTDHLACLLHDAYARLGTDEFSGQELEVEAVRAAKTLVDRVRVSWEPVDQLARGGQPDMQNAREDLYELGYVAEDSWRPVLSAWFASVEALFEQVRHIGRIKTNVCEEIRERLADGSLPFGPHALAVGCRELGRGLRDLGSELLDEREGRHGDDDHRDLDPETLRAKMRAALITAQARLEEAEAPQTADALQRAVARFTADVRQEFARAAGFDLAAEAFRAAASADEAADRWGRMGDALAAHAYHRELPDFSIRGYGYALTPDLGDSEVVSQESLTEFSRRAARDLEGRPERGFAVIRGLSELCRTYIREVFEGDRGDIHRLIDGMPAVRAERMAEDLWNWAEPRCGVSVQHQSAGKMATVDCLGAPEGSPLHRHLAKGHNVPGSNGLSREQVPLLRSLHGFPVSQIAKLHKYRAAFLSVVTTDRQETHLFADPDLALLWPLPGVPPEEVERTALFSLSEVLEWYTRTPDGYVWLKGELDGPPVRFRDELFAQFEASQCTVLAVAAEWDGLNPETQVEAITTCIEECRQRIAEAETEDPRGKQRTRRNERERGIRQLRSEVRALFSFRLDPGDPV